MTPYVAVVLVCLMSIPPEACAEKNAVDSLSTVVPSELGCSRGWQEIIARGSLREGIGTELYVKSLCRPKFKRSIPEAE